jgi:hypothetical protein
MVNDVEQLRVTIDHLKAKKDQMTLILQPSVV